MSSAYERVVTALRDRGDVKDDGRKASAPCPAHDDTNPSLSVAIGKTGDRAVIHCHAGCDTREILDALNLTDRDLFDDSTDYRYAGGAVVHRKPGKQFPQSGNKTDRSLFRVEHLPDNHAIPVYVVEGEKDANTVAYIDGAFAVSPRQGAATKPERYDWSPLKHRPVIVVADRDDGGRAHAERVAGLLENVAKSVVVVEAAEGKDLTDHVLTGHGLDELVPVDEEAGTTSSQTIDWAALLDGEPEPVNWLIPDVIAEGRSYALAGGAKAGKSLLMLDLLIRHRVRALYLDNEQTEDDLRTRVRAMGAGPDDLADPRRDRRGA
ncbi:AAA family ATPase [Gordonia sp. DT101]|uniref:AAA family ATPase n=1 Tax=Gordonia sp. DT101 TaxID=3416545 RepID=UPI003CFA13A7